MLTKAELHRILYRLIPNKEDRGKMYNFLKDLTTNEDMLEKQYAYGVLIDFTNGKSSPYLQRIGNMDLHRSLPIQSQYKRCLWSHREQKILFYLDPENSFSGKDDKGNTEFRGVSIKDIICGDPENEYAAISIPHEDKDMGAYEAELTSVRVHTPKFYYRSEVLETDDEGNSIKYKVLFSEHKISDKWQEMPELVTDFRNCRFSKEGDGTTTTSLFTVGYNMYALGGYNNTEKDTLEEYNEEIPYPLTGISRGVARAIAESAGTELLCYDYYKIILYWAFVIEYANLNSQDDFIPELTEDGFHQGGLGKGMVYGVKDGDDNLNWEDYFRGFHGDYLGVRKIGVTGEFGNNSGCKEVLVTDFSGNESRMWQNSYRGFEFPFGDVYTVLDGYIGTGYWKYDEESERDESEYQIYTSHDSSQYTDDLAVAKEVYNCAMSKRCKNANYGSYTRALFVGNNCEMIPADTSDDEGESVRYCDYGYLETEGTYMARVGGYARSGLHAGLGFLYGYNGPSYFDGGLGYKTCNVLTSSEE